MTTIVAVVIALIVGFAAGVAASVWFEWYTWAQDLLPGRDD